MEPGCFHGKAFAEVKPPKMIADCSELSRPGYTTITASEFQDSEKLLHEKIKLAAKVIQASKCCVVYTGAGISRAAGIADYASKAKNSIAGKSNPSLNRLQAEPTVAHEIIVGMEKKGYVHQWVQQNHDGLAQKAGFRQSLLNQIHGSWFDKKNPVVMMDDKLKPENYQRLCEWEQKVEVCLALGTSLSGMRADTIARSAAERGKLIIINLQQTPYDSISYIHIYAELQSAMQLLAVELAVVPKHANLRQSQWVK